MQDELQFDEGGMRTYFQPTSARVPTTWSARSRAGRGISKRVIFFLQWSKGCAIVVGSKNERPRDHLDLRLSLGWLGAVSAAS
jgi:hypothetical protein